MSDLIDREALLDDLRSLRNTAYRHNSAVYLSKAVDDLIGMVSRVKTVDAEPVVPTVNVWTPVEDGLPKEKGEYLVTVEHRFSRNNKDDIKDVVSYSVIQARFGSDWYFYSSYDDEYSDLNWYTTGILGIDISQKVIAWMPMPKAYKKGEAK